MHIGDYLYSQIVGSEAIINRIKILNVVWINNICGLLCVGSADKMWHFQAMCGICYENLTFLYNNFLGILGVGSEFRLWHFLSMCGICYENVTFYIIIF